MPPEVTENPEPAHDVSRASSSAWFWSIFVALGVLAVAGGTLYFGNKYFSSQNEVDTSRAIAPVSETSAVISEGLSGKLLLTLRDAESGDIGTYAYDFASGNFSRLFPVRAGLIINPRPSPDGSRLALATYGEDSTMQIFVAKTASDARAVTQNTLTYKREPQWSPQGDRIVYVAADEDSAEDPHFPDAWSIYIADMSGSERYVGRGYAPLFSPDGGRILFLKNDGLYLFDIQKETQEKVWDVVGGVAHSHMKLTLSPDSSLLAWSNHHARNEEGVVSLLRISSWEPFVMEAELQIPIAGVFSAFSPDGKNLAVQTTQLVQLENGGRERVGPKVMVYDIEKRRATPVFDLAGFDPSFMWVDYWVPQEFSIFGVKGS